MCFSKVKNAKSIGLFKVRLKYPVELLLFFLFLFSTTAWSALPAPSSYMLPTNTWAQLSLPANTAGVSIVNVFGDELPVSSYGDDWIIYTFDIAAQGYVVHDPYQAIGQGVGFWILQTTGSSVELDVPEDLPSAVTYSPDQCEGSACAYGRLATSSAGATWSMAGAPFSIDVPLDYLRLVNYNGNCLAGCSLSEAGLRVLWHFDVGTQSYINKIESKTLSPWDSVWFYTPASASSEGPVLMLPEPMPANADAIPSEGQGWVARHGLTGSQYQTEWEKWRNAGYRLTYVSGHEENRSGVNTAVYSAIWYDQPSVEWTSFHGQTSAQYQQTVTALKNQGYQPVFVDGYNVGSTVLYASIYEKSSVDWEARHNMNSAEYQAEVEYWVNERGYRIRHVSGYELNGQPYYAAVFDRSGGPAWVARHDMTSQQYQDEFEYWEDRGYLPVVIDGFYVGSTDYYTAIWHRDSSRFGARHSVVGQDYQRLVDDFYHEGFQPVIVDGYNNGSNVRYATLWLNKSWNLAELDELNNEIENFRTTWDIPSVSIAIAENERLVYAKAFGFADTESSESATTTHRYRIASLSKALTGAGVSMLIEQNQLSLDDRVFGIGGVLGNTFGTPDSSVATIEVRDLLEHTGGGWCGDGEQAIMFERVNDSRPRDWMISNTLENYPLTGTPATSFCYSNFGYLTLETVIEARNGGEPYIDFIKNALAAPSGADSLEIAGNRLGDRLSDEVKYYDNFDPYFWNVRRMGGHGGWLVTPVDYLRIMTRLDGESQRPDLLGSAGINVFESDDRVVSDDAWNSSNSYYAKGLVYNTSLQRWTHNGNFNGSVVEYARNESGVSMMVVVNMREHPSNGRIPLWQLRNDILSRNYQYPDFNLF